MLLTLEAMMMMGFPMDSLDLTGISAAQLGCIAGNAMESFSTAAAIVATLRLVDHERFKKAVSEAVGDTAAPWWKRKRE